MGTRARTARRFPAPPGQLIDIGTHRLHLHCDGDGVPPVVFDAALGASSLSWSLVQPAVATFTRACTYDRAGFGWSDAGPLPRTAGCIADELYELLQRATVPMPWVLVGHSFGGLVMRMLAARHPRAAAGLVLIEPAHPGEWMHPSKEQRQRIARGARLCGHGATAARLGLARAVAGLVGIGALGPARAVVKAISGGDLRRADESILAPIWKLPPEARRVLAEMWTQPKFFEALGSQIVSICESAAEVAREAPPDYGDLPLTVMTADSASPQRMQEDRAFAQRSTRGHHIVVQGTGHWVPLDAPGRVVDAIKDVVELVRRR